MEVLSGQTCDYFPFVDGCSHTPNFLKKFMATACVRHDLCYGCGVKYGFSRSFCDDMFYLDAASICDFNTTILNSLCKTIVNIMVSGVRLLGENRYQKYPDPWCHLPEVIECLPSLKIRWIKVAYL
ncbi:uncharacterized protein LOC134283762 [Saccostrea cucullata]|uniref:uncharacterized protein LOC134283762 n=1 Tax=Saccostrea cuccullata TaxID=36930 RepID=UPI002ED3D46A